jgi:hypothetical protein
MFIYPASRAKLVELLSKSGLLMEVELNISEAEMDFWSYQKDICK